MRTAALLLLLTAPALGQTDARSLYRRARAVRDRPDEALALAERAARAATQPDVRDAALRLVRDIRLDLGDVGGAAKALGDAGDGDPLTLALRAAAAGRADEARAQARRMVDAAAQTLPGDRADAFRHQAQILRQLGDDGAVEDSLKSALEAVPDYGPALRMMTELRLSQGRPKEAVSFIDRVVRSATATPAERAEAGGREAELLLSLGDSAGAEKTLAQARAILPDLPRVLAALASLRAAQGRLAEARQAASRLDASAGEGSPLSRALAWEQDARVRRSLGDDAGAERGLRRALALLPRRPETLAALAQLLLEKGRPAEALPLSERLVAASQTRWPAQRADALRLRARARLAAGDSAGAESDLRAALDVLPGGAGRRALAELLLSAGRGDEALELARRLGDPRFLARIQRARGDERGARASYERSLEADPDDLEALSALADLALERSRPEDALDFARRLVEVSTAPAARRAEALRLLARTQRALEDADGARKSLSLALEAVPDEPDSLRALADVDLSAGRLEQARLEAERLVALCPSDAPARRADAYQLAARVALALGDEAGAARDFRSILEAAPDSREALRALANLDLSAGRTEQARLEAERLVALSTAEPPSRRARDLLALARAQASLGDRAAAERSFRSALEAAPDDRDALRGLSELAASAGSPAEALRLAERAGAFREAARLALEAGDRAAARASLEKVLAAEPDDLETLSALTQDDEPHRALSRVKGRGPSDARRRSVWLVLRGDARGRSGDASAALDDYRTAVALDASAACFGPGLPKRRERLDPRYFELCLARFPKDAKLHMDRGVALFTAGRRDEAQAEFRRAQALQPAP